MNKFEAKTFSERKPFHPVEIIFYSKVFLTRFKVIEMKMQRELFGRNFRSGKALRVKRNKSWVEELNWCWVAMSLFKRFFWKLLLTFGFGLLSEESSKICLRVFMFIRFHISQLFYCTFLICIQKFFKNCSEYFPLHVRSFKFSKTCQLNFLFFSFFPFFRTQLDKNVIVQLLPHIIEGK